MLERLKVHAHTLKDEIVTVYLAAKDPRTPWYAKALILLVVTYALSPIDLIPDFIPILGYLDDLLLVPAGIALVIRLIPVEVLEEAREKVAGSSLERSVGYIGAGVVILLWVLTIIWLIQFIIQILERV